MRTRFFSLIPFLFLLRSVYGQDDLSMFSQAVEEDSSTIHYIVKYPENIRRDILEASSYPEVLVRMEALQRQTADRFRLLLSPYNTEARRELQQLTCYPALVSMLASGEKLSGPQLKLVLAEYPEQFHALIKDCSRAQREAIAAIDRLNREVRDLFEARIMDYPLTVREALRELVNYPELMDLLNNNLRTAALIGYVYKRDPGLVMDGIGHLGHPLDQQRPVSYPYWYAQTFKF